VCGGQKDGPNQRSLYSWNLLTNTWTVLDPGPSKYQYCITADGLFLTLAPAAQLEKA
jgi:hypothetical protein